MKNSTLKLAGVAFITFISCSNVSNICKHGFSGDSQQFSYKAFSGMARATPTYNDETAVNKQSATAPVLLTWLTLQDVKYVLKFNKELQMDFQYPVFGDNLKKLEGKELYITGYIIPLDVNQGLYALSRYPYASCYFCGRSGPESVISIKFAAKSPKYKLDKVLTLKGTLKLNDTNPMEFIYIFTNTEEYAA